MNHSQRCIVSSLIIYGMSSSLYAQEGSISIPSTLPDVRDQISKYDSGLFFCNESSKDKIYIAINRWSGGNWTSIGWFIAAKNGCVAALPTIENQYIYYYAESGDTKWEGNSWHCVHPNNAFNIPSGSCNGDNELYGFKEIVTGNVDKYVMTLK